ncbi:MAG: tRNA (cytidine(34)-2'-O)-methyltransferase [Eubacteriaceae bacterium]|jgi:tRNA (cytidine/uridine-2'-O-)-methyltransferase|nr:tRNA (cytidine(34)-2'-O)-methyltransferase [Eubacteriaceae bacterium]
MFHIVLYEPEIPQNTGNIARTCAVTGTALHLIRPYGFMLTDKNIKRAGLDYWDFLILREYSTFEEFMREHNPERIYAISSKAEKSYADSKFRDGDFFLFGNETSGLPRHIYDSFSGMRLRIPMLPDKRARCLNLGNAAAVILYEALRQSSFGGLR